MTPRFRKLIAPLAISAATAGTVQASSIVYYQLEGTGAPGTTAGAIVDSSGNSRNATAGVYGGATVGPSYSGVTPGTQIRDGVGGALINSNNTSSLRFTNPGVANGNYMTNGGGQVKLGDSPALRPASFTVEAFIRADNSIQYTSFIGKERSLGGTDATWLLDTNPGTVSGAAEPANMTLRARADHQLTGTATADGANQSFSSSGSVIDTTTGPNMATGWHHVAMTYNGDTNTFRLFVDYVDVTLGTGQLATPAVGGNPAGSAGDLVYTAGNLVFGGGAGGRGFDGWMDEIRLSDQILTANQFLRIEPIPEASSVMLLLGGLAGVIARRRR